jgi:hypothetical protein
LLAPGADPPTLTVDEAARMTRLTLAGPFVDPPLPNEIPRVTVEEPLTVTNVMENEGIVDFAQGSGVSEIKRIRKLFPQELPTSVVNVEAGAAVTVLQQSDVRYLNVVGGTFTFAQDSGTCTITRIDDEGSGAGVVTVENGAAVTVNATSRVAELGIDGALTLQEGNPPRVLIVEKLDLGTPTEPSGKLDLRNNGLIVDYTGSTVQDDIRSLIGSAHGAGAWTSNGITSTTAAGDAEHRTGIGYAEASAVAPGGTFLGQPVDSTAIVARFTLYGDTDLDTAVTLADFNRLAGNFGQMSNQVWFDGDSTYDGAVDLADFNRLAYNFGLTLGDDEGGGDGPAQQHYTYDELYAMLMDIVNGGGGNDDAM